MSITNLDGYWIEENTLSELECDSLVDALDRGRRRQASGTHMRPLGLSSVLSRCGCTLIAQPKKTDHFE